MTHIEFANLLSDYLDGLLAPEVALDGKAHLASCPECRSMVEDVRFGLAVCRDAREIEPAPWLMGRILRATTGERQPSLAARLRALPRYLLRPQLAYSVAMAVFSLSFLLYTSRVDLRQVKLRDLNPGTWVYHVDSQGHLLAARAEKFYFDLRFVYEVQSMLQDAGQQPGAQPEKKSQSPDGGATNRGLVPPRELTLDITPQVNSSQSGNSDMRSSTP